MNMTEDEGRCLAAHTRIKMVAFSEYDWICFEEQVQAAIDEL